MNEENEKINLNESTNETKEKSADDRIIETKNNIKAVEEEIDFSEKKLKSIEELEDLCGNIHSRLMKCAVLLGRSIKGKRVDALVKDIEETNQVEYRKTMDSLDNEREMTRKDLHNFNDEKDKLLKELSETYTEKDKVEVIKDKKIEIENDLNNTEKMGSEAEDAHNSYQEGQTTQE